ncbi:MAG TPA: tannase/feruloyl esterase family alpha/beta hydrolase [Bryobacteraceae bacterium]|nr:tannase/feruloyl esterase family alpha/beta hydrolase [Bryobacteraceae bacterium]
MRLRVADVLIAQVLAIGAVLGIVIPSPAAAQGTKAATWTPPKTPDWDYHAFNLDTDWPRLRSIGLRIDATIADLSAVRARGGKILQYHGWSDPGITPKMSIDYYESVRKTMGSKETDGFYRLFLVPGMGHCRGGAAACSNVDWLGAMVNWLEKGEAPSFVTGSHVENGA